MGALNRNYPGSGLTGLADDLGRAAAVIGWTHLQMGNDVIWWCGWLLDSEGYDII